MVYIIAWYTRNRIPYIVSKKGFEKLIQAKMVVWLPHFQEWTILTSEANIKKIAGAERLD